MSTMTATRTCHATGFPRFDTEADAAQARRSMPAATRMLRAPRWCAGCQGWHVRRTDIPHDPRPQETAS